MIRINGTLFILIAAILWGTTGTTQALAPQDANSLTIGALRLVVGGFGLLVFALARHRTTTPAPKNRWKRQPVVFGLLGVAVYQLCFFAGVARTGVAVGTIVGIGSAPVMTGLLATILFGERPTRRWMIATALAIAGCALLVLSGGEVGVDALGILLSLGAGLSYAIYTLASKALVEDHPPEQVMALFFCGAGLLLTPILLTNTLAWVFTFEGLIIVLHLGILATSVSYIFFARGLLTVPASNAVTLSLAEPLTAGILGMVVLQEQLTIFALFGILLLFMGLLFLTFKPTS